MERNISSDADVFLATFQGQRIKCATAEDAMAIQFAERMLRGDKPASPDHLARAVVVLRSYGCYTAANALSGQLARLRAAEFLKDSLGYVRPAVCRPK